MANTVYVSRSISEPIGELPYLVLDDDAGSALHALPGSYLAHAVCPWGTDTVFNRFQLPDLIHEIRAVAAESKEQGVQQELRGLADFLDKQANPVHDCYAMFIAD